MINPDQITNFNRTDAELEELALFCIAVAGHNAHTTAASLEKFLARIHLWNNSNYLYWEPFFVLKNLFGRANPTHIEIFLKEAGIGSYTKVRRAFQELVEAELNLRICDPEDLEKIYKIGKKTSRFFIIHSRAGIDNLAVIDRHALTFLKENSIEIPKTLTDKQYIRLEQEFIRLAKQSGKTIAEFDLGIWLERRILPKNNINNLGETND